MDPAIVHLAFIFIPGIIWANIDARYGVGQKPSVAFHIIRSFLFGVTTYFILYLIYLAGNYEFNYQVLVSVSNDLNLEVLWDEVLFSTILSPIIAIFWLYLLKHPWLLKFLRYITRTKRYGDEDVWSNTLNSSQANVEYVDLRDLETGYIYSGYVHTFSETEDDNRELLLSRAIVYDQHGVEISKAPFLYISRPKDKVWVEFPYRPDAM